MSEHPEILDSAEPEYLCTGGRDVGVVLQMNRKGDCYQVVVYNVSF